MTRDRAMPYASPTVCLHGSPCWFNALHGIDVPVWNHAHRLQAGRACGRAVSGEQAVFRTHAYRRCATRRRAPAVALSGEEDREPRRRWPRVHPQPEKWFRLCAFGTRARRLGCPCNVSPAHAGRRDTRRPFVIRTTRVADYPNATRALRNMRSHGDASGQSAGAQLKLALRGVRSGCGIRIVARPSSLLRPAMASVEPLGFAG